MSISDEARKDYRHLEAIPDELLQRRKIVASNLVDNLLNPELLCPGKMADGKFKEVMQDVESKIFK